MRYAILPHAQSAVLSSRIFALALLLLFSLAAAGAQTPQQQAKPQSPSTVPTIAVSILPQAEFVARIACDKARVLTLVGPGSSPHNYEPTPRQMAEMSGAILWFTLGIDFENAFLPKVKALYPRLKIVDTARNVIYRNLEEHGHEEEETHGHEGETAHGGSFESDGARETEEESGRDPHIWLGQEAVKMQLIEIRDALSAAMPAAAALFHANHEAYRREIDAAFARLAKELAGLKGSTVFVYHPSFGYFFDNFGIRQEAVEVGGKEPTQKTLSLLIKQAKEEGARVIFVQKQFSPEAARTVAKAIGGAVVEIDPLAPEWLRNIEIMGNALKKAAPR